MMQCSVRGACVIAFASVRCDGWARVVAVADTE